jgi:hypothetical protein
LQTYRRDAVSSSTMCGTSPNTTKRMKSILNYYH